MAKTLVSDLVGWRDGAIKAAEELDQILSEPALKQALNESGPNAKAAIIDAEYKLKDYAKLLEEIMKNTEIPWPPGK